MQQTNNIHSFHRVNSDGIFDHPQAADFWPVTHLESFNQEQLITQQQVSCSAATRRVYRFGGAKVRPAGDGIGPCG